MSKRNSKRQDRTKRPAGVFVYDDHPMVSRRDFLAAGFIKFSAAVFAPTLFTHLIRPTLAEAACGSSSGSTGPSLPAFIQFNLAGGAGLGANFVPRNASGSVISSMDLMGLGSTATAIEAQLVTEFGSVQPSFFEPTATTAGLIRGIRSTATDPNTLARTAVIGIVAQGRDDTNLNPLDITGLVAQAGLAGGILPGLSTSNFGQTPTLIRPPTPLTVNSYQDISSAVGVAGPLGALTPTQKTAVFKLVDRLSESQANRLLGHGLRNADELQELIGCATTANIDVAAGPPVGTDPRLDASVAAAWGITAASNAASESVVFASCVYNALKTDGSGVAQAGPVRIQKGGYDYHDGTRTSGDARDFEAGQIVGRILETARILNRKTLLFLTTDGATRSEQSNSVTSPWVSDRGQANVTIVFVYDPAGRPSTGFLGGVTENAGLRNQIGYLTSGQSADNNYTSDWNAERAATAVFANYLAWTYRGTGTDWRTIYSQVLAARSVTNPFSTAELNKVMRLA